MTRQSIRRIRSPGENGRQITELAAVADASRTVRIRSGPAPESGAAAPAAAWTPGRHGHGERGYGLRRRSSAVRRRRRAGSRGGTGRVDRCAPSASVRNRPMVADSARTRASADRWPGRGDPEGQHGRSGRRARSPPRPPDRPSSTGWSVPRNRAVADGRVDARSTRRARAAAGDPVTATSGRPLSTPSSNATTPATPQPSTAGASRHAAMLRGHPAGSEPSAAAAGHGGRAGHLGQHGGRPRRWPGPRSPRSAG